MSMILRGFGNYDGDMVSAEVGLLCEDGTRAQQQFAEECDINTIVRRFGLTGELPAGGVAMPVSGDFTDALSFEESMFAVRRAQEGFMTLTADLRRRFGNDPGQLIAFLENKDNKDEAIKLGLVKAPVEKPRDVIMAVDELAKALKPAG